MGEPGRCPHGREESRAPHGLPDVLQARVAELEARVATLTAELPCPDSPECATCDCAGEDDVCFPDEAVRALRARAEAAEREAATLREALDGLITTIDNTPTYVCDRCGADWPCLPSEFDSRHRRGLNPAVEEMAGRARAALAGTGRSTEGKG